jgi:outer membrane biosynthesis protein TonB
MTAALVIAALVAVAAVLLAALPFLRDPSPTADRLERQDELERRALELAEERDRALAALKELEFDHRTGKVSDNDYRRLVGPLRIRAAQTLRALEPEVPAPPEPPPPQPPPGPTPPEPVPEPYPPDEITPPAPPLIPEPGPRS